jgi:hypothetical protein
VISWALSVIHSLLGWANMMVAFRLFEGGVSALAVFNVVLAVTCATLAGFYAAEAQEHWTL